MDETILGGLKLTEAERYMVAGYGPEWNTRRYNYDAVTAAFWSGKAAQLNASRHWPLKWFAIGAFTSATSALLTKLL